MSDQQITPQQIKEAREAMIKFRDSYKPPPWCGWDVLNDEMVLCKAHR